MNDEFVVALTKILHNVSFYDFDFTFLSCCARFESFEQVTPLLLHTLVFCFFNLCENIQFIEILLLINLRVAEWQLLLHNWIIF
jgi:hypothetical protein